MRDSQDILLSGLKKLEYRGYDSAGVAVYTENGLEIRKAEGRLAVLESQLQQTPLLGSIGIGHTRWATHGKPSDSNSHPHTDQTMKFSVVHNGIIENYLDLKEELMLRGHTFVSETDTEIISHLIAEEYQGDIVQAVQKAIQKMRGAYAIAVLTEYEPDKLVAVRLASPLIIGIGEGENFIGSDIPAQVIPRIIGAKISELQRASQVAGSSFAHMGAAHHPLADDLHPFQPTQK